ncbi:hypothetical protein [Bacillus sp. UNC438CL73TsuS30]|uniref:hypothetical protein n=1 Tax=Bacillus sp. UNC438CL73TsuS30 TaxID=1340434 RepID=UPI000478B554|nr:hypothetical protein [Bacillus sp. UNC438CL73TsuS30]
MEKEQAISLSNCIEKWNGTGYEITQLKTIDDTLPKFHQWTNGKPVVAGYKVTRIDYDTSYYFIFIDWHRNDKYYLVIYTHDKSTTVAEIRNVEEVNGDLHLLWAYNPLKRDGKNAERKAYFKQMFGSVTVQIKLPSSPLDLAEFFSQLFLLCSRRIKADRIVEVFDFDDPHKLER